MVTCCAVRVNSLAGLAARVAALALSSGKATAEVRMHNASAS
jgi:hypothetical protein